MTGTALCVFTEGVQQAILPILIGRYMMEKKTQPVAAMKPLALLVGASVIDKAIASIKSRGAKLDDSIQQAGVSVLMHIDQHCDTTLADRLFNAMPKGSRRNSLAMWMLAFGKVRVLDKANKDDAEALKTGRVFQYDKSKSTDRAGAEAKAWYDMQKEKDIAEVFDVQAAVASLLKRIKNMETNGVKIEHQEIVATLETLTK